MHISDLIELGKEADQLLATVKILSDENAFYKEQQEWLYTDIKTMQATSTQSLFNMMAVLSVPGVLDLLRANKEFVALHSKTIEDSNENV